MFKTINEVHLLGTIAKTDAETKNVGRVNEPLTLSTFTLTLSDGKKGKDGKWEYSNIYIPVEIWNFDAYPKLKWKSTVEVYGRLKQDSWEKDGKTVTRMKVIANKILFPGENNLAQNNNDANSVAERNTSNNEDTDIIPF